MYIIVFYEEWHVGSHEHARVKMIFSQLLRVENCAKRLPERAQSNQRHTLVLIKE